MCANSEPLSTQKIGVFCKRSSLRIFYSLPNWWRFSSFTWSLKVYRRRN